MTRVAAENVDKTLEMIRKQHIQYQAADRAVIEGDRVKLDFNGTLDGKDFEGGKGENIYLVAGEGRFIQNFEAALLGMQAGEEKTFDVVFPEDYHGKEIAGLIYLSPVIDPELITEERYSPILKTTPVLVISGSADRRVPETYVQRGIDNLRSLPLSVEAHFIPDEDHFLFFSQPERVLGLIDDWLDQHIRIRP